MRVFVAAVLGCLLVAGCSDGEAVRPAPLPTESETAGASPTIPTNAQGKGPSGAVAFASFYVSVISEAIQTGDSHLVRALGSPECVSCTAVAENVDRIYGAGGRAETRGWEVREATYAGKAKLADVAISLEIWQYPATTFTSASAEPEHTKGERRYLFAYLSRHQGAWRVERLDLVEKQ